MKENTKENKNSNAIANQALQKKSEGVSIEPPKGLYLKSLSNPSSKSEENLKVNDGKASQNNIQLKSPVIQRAPIKGIVTVDTKLVEDSGNKPKKGGLMSSNTIGKTLKTGTELQVDFDVKKENHYQVEAGVSWVPVTKVIDYNNLQSQGPDFEAEGGELAGDTSGYLDDVSDNLEGGYLKENDGTGMYDDKEDLSESNLKIQDSKNRMDFASGTLKGFQGLYGMYQAYKSFGEETELLKKAQAFGEGLESASAVVSGSSKAVDGMSKALGNEDGTSKDGNGVGSDIMGKFTGTIDDSIGALKNSFLAFMGVYNLFTNESNQKGYDALVTTKQMTQAALSAAKVAKGTYDIIGKGIPMELMNTIPGLGIAVSAINLIIRFADAWQAGDDGNLMETKSKNLKVDVLAQLWLTEGTQNLAFREDKRGTFPIYTTYYRIIPTVLKDIDKAYEEGKKVETKIGDITTPEGLQVKNSKDEFDAKVQALNDSETAVASADSESSQIENETFELLKSNNGLVTPEYTALYNKWKVAQEKQKEQEAANSLAKSAKKSSEIAKNSLPDTIVAEAVKGSLDRSTLPAIIKASLCSKVNGKDDLENLLKVSDAIKEYELVDKIAEINQKRKVSGYTDVAKELVSITANVLSLTGVGAAVGVGMTAVSGAATLAHSAGKFVQGHYRNKDYGKTDVVDKSSKHKHEEYVQHTQHIFKMLGKAKTKEDAENVLAILKATGVNTGLLFAHNGDPTKQAEMIVESMKKRN